MKEENQQLSIRKNYIIGEHFGCLTIVECLDTLRFKTICTCGCIHELSQSSLYGYYKNNTQWCKNCKPLGVNKTKYQAGEILGNCFKLIKHLGGNSWEVECNKCHMVQSQSIPNMNRHKGNVCYYCKHPNATRNHQGGKGVISGPIEERFYNYYKGRIKSDNLNGKKYKEWNLSLEEFSTLVRGNCAYCGDSPQNDNQWSRNKRKISADEDYSFNGIDRVNSNIGYTLDNCVSCCPTCNSMKSDMDKDLFLKHITRIYTYFNVSSTTIENTSIIDGSE